MTKSCPACGAEVADSDLVCSFCGSSMTPVSLSFEQRNEIIELIHSLNQNMLKEEKRLVRQVDLLSTLIWLMGIVAIWVAGTLMHSNSLKTGMLVFSAGVLLFWRSYRRKNLSGGLVSFFKQTVETKIISTCDHMDLPRWQFEQVASRELNENDPLHKFMFIRSTSR